MKKLIYILVLFILFACEKNDAPDCQILSPGNGSTFESGQDISISVQASDPDGELQKTELFIDGDKLSEYSGFLLNYTLNSTGLAVGEHKISAIATDDAGMTGEDEIYINIDPIELDRPEGLSTYAKEEEIYLAWWGVTNATSYNVFWTDDNSDPSTNSNKINTSDTYLFHKNLDPTKTYKYRVQAVNGIFTSPLSDMISDSPKMQALPPPTDVTATTSASSISISWTAVDVAGVTYSIKRKESTGYFSEIANDLVSTEYTDNTIELGKGYYYKVIAHDAATSRTSDDSETCYGVISKTIYESERNNENVSSTLQYNTHYWDAEDVTLYLDKYRIKGSYSGAYRIYSAASYKNFDADCFNLDLENGDIVEFKLISGNMSGLWSMGVGLRVYVKSTSGNYSDGKIYSFNSPSDSYTFNHTTSGTLMGVYLDISMWEDLINYGPYNYEIEITIKRKE